MSEDSEDISMAVEVSSEPEATLQALQPAPSQPQNIPSPPPQPQVERLKSLRRFRPKALLRKRPDFLTKEMKPNVVVDEMFPEGAGPYMDIDEAGGSSGLLMDLAANEKSVHTDFFNQFDDLYDDEDLS